MNETSRCLGQVAPSSAGICLMIAILLVWYLGRLYYNVFLHPLSRFPGPRLAAASRWYEAYFDLCVGMGGQFMYEMNRLHERYGPIVRIGPNEVHISDSSFRDTLYTLSQKRDKVSYMVDVFNTPQSMFGTKEHDLHRSRRKVLNPFFASKNVQDLDQSIYTKVHKMCDILQKQYVAGRDIKIRHALTSCTVDIATGYSFNKCANALQDDEFTSDWENMVTAVSEFVPIAKQYPGIVKIARLLPLSLVRKLNPVMAAFAHFELTMRRDIIEIIRNLERVEPKTREPKNEGPSIFHQIFGTSLSKEENMVDRMAQEALSIVAASSETSTNMLSTTLFFLATERTCLLKLFNELKIAMPMPNSYMGWKDLEKLPYLTAVVKEGLRIAAPICSRLPLISPRPMTYKDWTIPAGTFVGMSLIDFLHNPEIYPHPLEFRPERWLTASPEHLREMERAFIPFGHGPRICLGINLAYANLYHVIANVCRRFDFTVVDTVRERDVDVARDYFASKPSKASKGVTIRILGEHE